MHFCMLWFGMSLRGCDKSRYNDLVALPFVNTGMFI